MLYFVSAWSTVPGPSGGGGRPPCPPIAVSATVCLSIVHFNERVGLHTCLKSRPTSLLLRVHVALGHVPLAACGPRIRCRPRDDTILLRVTTSQSNNRIHWSLLNIKSNCLISTIAWRATLLIYNSILLPIILVGDIGPIVLIVYYRPILIAYRAHLLQILECNVS